MRRPEPQKHAWNFQTRMGLSGLCLFVTARVAVGNFSAGIIAPKSALQTFEGRTVLFVRTDKGFSLQVETERLIKHDASHC